MDPDRETPSWAQAPVAGRLRALVDLAGLVRSDCELSELLAAVARLLSESLGFASVTINLYRPLTDDYEVTAVHGPGAVTPVGHVSRADAWAPTLDPRLSHRGAIFVAARASEDDAQTEPDRTAPRDPSQWLEGDTLLVALSDPHGERLGIISLAELRPGLRPDDMLLDVLVAVAAHVSRAIEHRRHLVLLREALARHRAVIATSHDAVLAFDPRGRVLEFNPAAELMFGYRSEEAVNREFAELLLEPQDRDDNRRALELAFAQQHGQLTHRRLEVAAVCADGRRLPVELSLTLVQGSQPREPILYGVARDISERLRGSQQLAYLAYHDRLTGLPNRILVEDQLDLAVARARRMNRAVALLFVDLDDFKAVNDRLGHAAGDQFLAAVAKRLRRVLRDTDVLARQGGDEFLVLLSDLDDGPEHVAEAVGAKLHAALKAPFNVAGTELLTAASVGVSLYPDDASDSEALLRQADAAMYKAKAAGGGRLVFHRATETISAHRASVSTQLRAAIANSELELHYLPVWRLGARRTILGVEALLRWRHPDGSLLTPESFIPLAEHSAVANDLVDWVLHQACRDTRDWLSAGLRPRVSLNVSPHQLLASEFGARMQAALGVHELDPSGFMIELTESAWTFDATNTLAAVAALRAAGVALAIDDFGAGFSSLSRLHELEVDVVKLDRTLLTAVPDDPAAAEVLKAIVGLVCACGAALVAEGVESEAQAQWLEANGIDRAQGFLFGHPMRAPELTPLLAAHLLTDRVAS